MPTTPDSQLEEALAFRESLSSETDRGCALLAASYLDDQLRLLLEASLVSDAKVAEGLFEPNGPLGTFSGRVDVSYMFGLVGKVAHRDLHLIRKIRNDFGHSPKPIDFQEPAIAARCRELVHRSVQVDQPSRKLFTSAVLGVLGVIHAVRSDAKPADAAKDVKVDEEFRLKVREIAEEVRKAVREGDG